jgi:hypothetical protein
LGQNKEARVGLVLFTDYLLDQGLIKGGRNVLPINSYENARKLHIKKFYNKRIILENMKYDKKKLTGFIFFIGLWFMLGTGIAQTRNNDLPGRDKVLRLLVIGNSFSRNATLYLPQLANEGGYRLIIEKAEISGGPLKTHWNAVETSEMNENDPKGKPYNGKSLKTLLSENVWDIVTMQQGSVVSADADTYNPYITNLYNFIRKLQPHAEIVIHQTWAYRKDARGFSKIRGEERAKDQREMWEKSRETYHSVADQLGLRIIPTGDAFWEVSSDSKWAYQKDPDFNFSKPVYPELPDQKNSLNVGYTWAKNKTFKLDANHANNAGCYLGALTWYSFLFGKSPANLKFVPEDVSQDFAEYLRKVAWKAVEKVNVSKKRH